MANDAEAAKAIAALDGRELGGHNLKVNEAQPKGEHPHRRTSGGRRHSDGAVVADSRMKITANRLASRARRAGKRAAHRIDCNEFETLGGSMATTFLKRQKEMKRQEKQREKAERRKQKKLAQLAENVNLVELEDAFVDSSERSEPHPPK
jgi:hypothetical protein